MIASTIPPSGIVASCQTIAPSELAAAARDDRATTLAAIDAAPAPAAN